MRGRMNGRFITACHISVIILDSHPAALHDAIKNNSRNTKTYVVWQRSIGMGVMCATVKTPKWASLLHVCSFFHDFFFLKIWFRWTVFWSSLALCTLVLVKLPQDQIGLTPVYECGRVGADFQTTAGRELSGVWGKPPRRRVVLKQQRQRVGGQGSCLYTGNPGLLSKKSFII